ncbi:MAG: hypothetical protein J6Q14_08120 [Oscillospiraceae bacterium]|nr:hypothetical protein [Oscillospiraceae bacterium]
MEVELRSRIHDIYDGMKEVLRLAWDCDDLMSQDTLFQIQDKLADLALITAVAARQEKDLVREFPYIYTFGEEK